MSTKNLNAVSLMDALLYEAREQHAAAEAFVKEVATGDVRDPDQVARAEEFAGGWQAALDLLETTAERGDTLWQVSRKSLEEAAEYYDHVSLRKANVAEADALEGAANDIRLALAEPHAQVYLNELVAELWARTDADIHGWQRRARLLAGALEEAGVLAGVNKHLATTGAVQ